MLKRIFIFSMASVIIPVLAGEVIGDEFVELYNKEREKNPTLFYIGDTTQLNQVNGMSFGQVFSHVGEYAVVKSKILGDSSQPQFYLVPLHKIKYNKTTKIVRPCTLQTSLTGYTSISWQQNGEKFSIMPASNGIKGKIGDNTLLDTLWGLFGL